MVENFPNMTKTYICRFKKLGELQMRRRDVKKTTFTCTIMKLRKKSK
jgi:hypothetical protein